MWSPAAKLALFAGAVATAGLAAGAFARAVMRRRDRLLADPVLPAGDIVTIEGGEHAWRDGWVKWQVYYSGADGAYGIVYDGSDGPGESCCFGTVSEAVEALLEQMGVPKGEIVPAIDEDPDIEPEPGPEKADDWGYGPQFELVDPEVTYAEESPYNRLGAKVRARIYEGPEGYVVEYRTPNERVQSGPWSAHDLALLWLEDRIFGPYWARDCVELSRPREVPGHWVCLSAGPGETATGGWVADVGRIAAEYRVQFTANEQTPFVAQVRPGYHTGERWDFVDQSTDILSAVAAAQSAARKF